MQKATHNHLNLLWLVNHYKAHGVAGVKTLVFTNSIDDARKLYFFMLDELDESGMLYQGRSKAVQNRIMDMYHAHVDTESDKRIRTEFSKPDSTIRLLISTIKMGMGVDIPDINLVVIFGVATHVIDLWQEIGRCARGQGQHGLAVMYITGKSLSSCTDQSIIKLASGQHCFRETILTAFKLEGMEKIPAESNEPLTGCTRNCQIICECSRCRCCNFCAELCPCPGAKATIDELLNEHIQG